MQAVGLVERIVLASGVPSARRRREIARELRSHIEDFTADARARSYSDSEIERMLLANFGDPERFGRNFAWVYRRERALARLAAFFATTLLVTALAAAGILAAQAGVAAGLGMSFYRTFGGHHSVIECAHILATAAAYVGILSFEKYLSPLKSIALLLAIAAAGFGLLSAAGLGAAFLVFGLVNAVFLRFVQRIFAGRMARFLLVAACFGLLGSSLYARSSVTPLAAVLASWLAMGIGYQAMAGLAARVDRGLEKLQQL